MMGAFQTFKVALIASLIGLAAGCADIQTSASATPGPQPANPSDAGRLFAKGCLQTLPDFATVKTALAGEPFTIHATFGTFYHNQQNLSIKVVDTNDGGYCSIVFLTTGDPVQNLTAFGRVVDTLGRDIDADVALSEPRPGPNGLTLYNARTNAQ
jgi:hypothetical protein